MFDEWGQLKATDETPFAASRHFPQRGQRVGATLKITPKITKGESAPPLLGAVWIRLFWISLALQAFSSGSGAARPATSETGREKTMPLAFLAMPSSL